MITLGHLILCQYPFLQYNQVQTFPISFAFAAKGLLLVCAGTLAACQKSSQLYIYLIDDIELFNQI